MMSNGVRRNLGDPTGFPSLTEYRRTIEKKGVETTRWESDQFIVDSGLITRAGNGAHSKGLKLVCNGKGKHSPNTDEGKAVQTKLDRISEIAKQLSR